MSCHAQLLISRTFFLCFNNLLPIFLKSVLVNPYSSLRAHTFRSEKRLEVKCKSSVIYNSFFFLQQSKFNNLIFSVWKTYYWELVGFFFSLHFFLSSRCKAYFHLPRLVFWVSMILFFWLFFSHIVRSTNCATQIGRTENWDCYRSHFSWSLFGAPYGWSLFFFTYSLPVFCCFRLNFFLFLLSFFDQFSFSTLGETFGSNSGVNGKVSLYESSKQSRWRMSTTSWWLRLYEVCFGISWLWLIFF